LASAPIDIPVKVRGLSDLQKLEKRMEQLERDLAKVAKVAPKAANGIRQTGRAAGTATGNIQRMGIAFRTTLGPIVAVTGALTFLSRSLTTFAEREADVKLLTAGIKRLGGTEADLARLNKQADEFGNATLFNQEDFNQSAGLLTSFTDVAVKDYQRIIDISGDLAQTNRTGLKDSTLQLAKALNDPVANLSALSRSGIQFSEVQKDLIKSLVDTGQKATAQRIILKELERQYGGAAKAAATGLAGAQDSLGESFRDLQEVIGKGISPTVERLTKDLTGVFEALSQIDPKVIESTAELVEYAVKIGAVVLGIKGLVALKAAVVGFFAASTAGALKLNAALLANPWTAAIAGLTALGIAINKNIQKQRKFNELVNGGVPPVQDLDENISQLKTSIEDKNEELIKASEKYKKYTSKMIYAESKANALRDKVEKLRAELNQLKGVYDIRIRLFTEGTAQVRGSGFTDKLQNTIDELKNLGYDYNDGIPIKIQPEVEDTGGGSGSGSIRES